MARRAQTGKGKRIGRFPLALGHGLVPAGARRHPRCLAPTSDRAWHPHQTVESTSFRSLYSLVSNFRQAAEYRTSPIILPGNTIKKAMFDGLSAEIVSRTQVFIKILLFFEHIHLFISFIFPIINTFT